jgi:hypothetical protein
VAFLASVMLLSRCLSVRIFMVLVGW